MALLAAQMYTLRNQCKTVPELAEACKRVKAMGYDGVQLSGVVEVAVMKCVRFWMIRDWHVRRLISLDSMETTRSWVIERHQKMGCKYTAIGGYFPKKLTLELWEGFIAKYNTIAAKFAGGESRSGTTTTAMNPARQRSQAVDLLMQRLDPEKYMDRNRYLLEYSTAVRIVEYIRRAAGRMPCVHFKDMTITPQRNHKMTEIGDGNLNWLVSSRLAGMQECNGISSKEMTATWIL